MTSNSSPYWERVRRENMRPEPTGQSAPSEPYAELFAVLDRADVSEAVRAACAHALNPPNSSGNRYTLHLTFPAGDLTTARDQAASYAEALIMLRPEVGLSPALLSRADQWNHVEPVTCGLIGPDGEQCNRPIDHLGCHRDDLTLGLCWGDDQATGDALDGDDGHDDPTGQQ
ncbi:hypothetical protein GCM10027280_46120 [Micromonospora polyrhachis]|uniref:Uncharacterized protein n=1 Tax=Micromonospora polyrhachis TaxID=1282883 RepID=A0A7W7WQE9_9ACTN|nr:hypothetical protein [Micromonospora polyrhachis]MBB4959223.1 hypothetical protein [Micromonospora polyrhachis]